MDKSLEESRRNIYGMRVACIITADQIYYCYKGMGTPGMLVVRIMIKMSMQCLVNSIDNMSTVMY